MHKHSKYFGWWFFFIFEFAHEGCLYLIKNKVKTEIFWIIIANLKEKFKIF